MGGQKELNEKEKITTINKQIKPQLENKLNH